VSLAAAASAARATSLGGWSHRTRSRKSSSHSASPSSYRTRCFIVNRSNATTFPLKNAFSRGQNTLSRVPVNAFRASSETRFGVFAVAVFFAPADASFRGSRHLSELLFFNATPEGVVGYARFASASAAARLTAASARVARGCRVARVRATIEARFGGRMAVRRWSENGGSERK
jgi:hypothetical protein